MRKVAVVGGVRTPFLRAGTFFADESAISLGAHVVNATLTNSSVSASLVDELVFSSVLLDPRTPNLAREILFKSDLPGTIPAHFISNNCISGLVALSAIVSAIGSGRINCGIAGGVELMSRPALTLKPAADAFFAKLHYARGWSRRMQLLSKFRPDFLLPQAVSPKEPSTGLTMGEHCELTNKEFMIGRETQDRYALESHQKAFKARAQGIFAKEISPYQTAKDLIKDDSIIRADTSLEKLARLKPVFCHDGDGTLTAGNSSALTDGASAVCLMEYELAKKQGLNILSIIEEVQFSALEAQDGLLMAPVFAVERLLKKAQISFADIDNFEIHEAFAAQVLGTLKAWESGWPRFREFKPLGAIPPKKINVNGGSLAIGHPFAATGGRLVINLSHQLQQSGKELGLISTCAAGAMGAAVLIRNPG